VSDREVTTHLIPGEAEYRAKRHLELVHSDLCGQISPATLRGNKYFLLLVDDLSRYMSVITIPFKDRAAVVIKDIQARTEGESDLKMKTLHIDCEGGFTATKFTDYCAAEGVYRRLTTHIRTTSSSIRTRRW
jgi:hypothetical protein